MFEIKNEGYIEVKNALKEILDLLEKLDHIKIGEKTFNFLLELIIKCFVYYMGKSLQMQMNYAFGVDLILEKHQNLIKIFLSLDI